MTRARAAAILAWPSTRTSPFPTTAEISAWSLSNGIQPGADASITILGSPISTRLATNLPQGLIQADWVAHNGLALDHVTPTDVFIMNDIALPILGEVKLWVSSPFSATPTRCTLMVATFPDSVDLVLGSHWATAVSYAFPSSTSAFPPAPASTDAYFAENRSRDRHLALTLDRLCEHFYGPDDNSFANLLSELEATADTTATALSHLRNDSTVAAAAVARTAVSNLIRRMLEAINELRNDSPSTMMNAVTMLRPNDSTTDPSPSFSATPTLADEEERPATEPTQLADEPRDAEADEQNAEEPTGADRPHLYSGSSERWQDAFRTLDALGAYSGVFRSRIDQLRICHLHLCDLIGTSAALECMPFLETRNRPRPELPEAILPTGTSDERWKDAEDLCEMGGFSLEAFLNAGWDLTRIQERIALCELQHLEPEPTDARRTPAPAPGSAPRFAPFTGAEAQDRWQDAHAICVTHKDSLTAAASTFLTRIQERIALCELQHLEPEPTDARRTPAPAPGSAPRFAPFTGAEAQDRWQDAHAICVTHKASLTAAASTFAQLRLAQSRLADLCAPRLSPYLGPPIGEAFEGSPLPPHHVLDSDRDDSLRWADASTLCLHLGFSLTEFLAKSHILSQHLLAIAVIESRSKLTPALGVRSAPLSFVRLLQAVDFSQPFPTDSTTAVASGSLEYADVPEFATTEALTRQFFRDTPPHMAAPHEILVSQLFSRIQHPESNLSNKDTRIWSIWVACQKAGRDLTSASLLGSLRSLAADSDRNNGPALRELSDSTNSDPLVNEIHSTGLTGGDPSTIETMSENSTLEFGSTISGDDEPELRPPPAYPTEAVLEARRLGRTTTTIVRDIAPDGYPTPVRPSPTTRVIF
ncbi:hypothetical protein RQP46_007851 [Phenoliferia psychrophenolica]